MCVCVLLNRNSFQTKQEEKEEVWRRGRRRWRRVEDKGEEDIKRGEGGNVGEEEKE